jgi:hypothetical protein
MLELNDSWSRVPSIAGRHSFIKHVEANIDVDVELTSTTTRVNGTELMPVMNFNKLSNSKKI